MASSKAALLFGIIAISSAFVCVQSQSAGQVNSFEANLMDSAASSAKAPKKNDFTPPPSEKSKFSWEPSTFGQCFGCGSRSFRHVTQDCVHRQPMQLSVGNYSKTVMGVFKATEDECIKRNTPAPAPVSVMGCGPPCSELRLLRGATTGCRCNRKLKVSYDVPKLVCQDNRNRTVPLALCKFFYEKNTVEYQPIACDYNDVCTGKIGWISGNWSVCSHENSVHQSREIVCAAPSARVGIIHYVMHESECTLEEKPQKMQLCARWTAEKRFKCNCYTRQSARLVMCMRKRIRTDEADCSWHQKPETKRPCDSQQLALCSKPGGKSEISF